MQSHYDRLKEIVFRPSNGLISYTPRGDIRGRVAFQLDRDFNDLSSYVIFDFLVDLYKVFGKPIIPIEIGRGCIAITAAFESATDFRGIDFRALALTDPRYHDIFRRYGVQKLYVHAFPDKEDVPDLACEVDSSGRPQAYKL